MVGIKESKDVLTFIIAVLKEVDKRPKKVNAFTLIPILLRLAPKTAKAFNGIKELPAEFKDLDEVERQELIAVVKNDVSLSNEKVEDIVDKIIEVIIRLSYILDVFTKK